MGRTLLWCAKCARETAHNVSIDRNREFVAHCGEETCDRFMKFPEDHALEFLEENGEEHGSNVRIR